MKASRFIRRLKSLETTALCMVFFSIAAVSSVPLLAESDPAERGRPWIQTYTDRDGLPQGSAETMAVDSHGRLWVGTRGGAVRFDGRQWTPIHLPDRDGSKWVRSVVVQGESIQLATESGELHRLDADGSWQSSRLPETRRGQVLGLWVIGNDEELWCVTSDGLTVYRDNVWQAVDLPLLQGSILSASADLDGLLLGTENGWIHGRDEEWQQFGPEQGLPFQTVHAVGSSRGPNSNLVHLAGDSGLVVYDGQDFKLDPRPGLPEGRINTFVYVPRPDGSNELWIGTLGDGLFRPEADRWVLAVPTRELPSGIILSMLADPDWRHVIVGTLHGIAAIRLDGWVALDEASGLPHRSVSSFGETSLGFWLGTSAGGATRWQDGRWYPLGEEQGLPHPAAWVVHETGPNVGKPSSQSLWIGTEAGLYRRQTGDRQTGNVSLFNSKNGLPRDQVVALASDSSRQVLWAGTFGDGALSFDFRDESWTVPDHQWLDGRVEALELVPRPQTHQDSALDDLWVATNRGLVRLRGETWSDLPIEDLPDPVVRSFHLTRWDDDDVLLIGTGSGLAWTDPHLDRPQWQQLDADTAAQLPDDVIYRIEEDTQGRLYLCTHRGVARLTRHSGQDLFDLDLFGIEDGLPAYECNFGSSTTDRQGRIWVGTPAGAAVFDPRRELPEPAPASLRLEATLLSDPPRILRDGDVLEHDEHQLRLTYDLDTLFGKKDVRFSTHLVNLEPDPSRWTASSSRELVGLPPGNYRFEVRARDHLGREIGPISLSFRRAPPPWLSAWAKSLYVLILVTAAYVLLRLRTRPLKQRIRELETRVAQQDRQLQRLQNEGRRSGPISR